MENDQQYCPVCGIAVHPSARYPKYVCRDCAAKATDENGRNVLFVNTDFSGGCEGMYADTKEKYDSNICYIDGQKCVADEARFGGIVIEKK